MSTVFRRLWQVVLAALIAVVAVSASGCGASSSTQARSQARAISQTSSTATASAQAQAASTQSPAPTAASLASSSITVDGSDAGQTFEGVGAITGAQARYLTDYPAAQQHQIMEDLFAPKYGASLQMLKVEIGGDSNTTDGAEPSVESTKGVVNCNVGDEWQFMEQAKALNPALKIYALAWGTPGWDSNFYSQTNINYFLTWLGCAKQHGITVNYIGGSWNEHGFNPSQMSWYEALRQSLDQHGYKNLQIVAADSTWDVVNSLAASKKFAAAVGVVGEHDPCSYPTTGLLCSAPQAARNLDKPLWGSEVGHMYKDTGSPDMVRALNRGYIDAGLTGYITWPIIMSAPAYQPAPNFGLITAAQPWSGYYQVNEMTWAIAQTTQFTASGWRYLNGASGYFGGDRDNGSYVTLRSNTSNDWSLIAETTTAKLSREVTVTIKPGLSQKVVHVFATNLASSNSADWFTRLSNVPVSGGKFTYVLKPGFVYTFSTTSGQVKGDSSVSVPSSKAFPLPYTDSFSQMDSSDQPKYFGVMDGSFESAPCKGNVTGNCLQQMTLVKPNTWIVHPAFPHAIIGDTTLENYTVAVDLLFPNHEASAGVIARYSYVSPWTSYFDGYILNVSEGGSWKIIDDTNQYGVTKTLASGQLPEFGVDSWLSVALTVNGDSLVATVDGTTVARMNVPAAEAYDWGIPGIESGAFSGTFDAVQYRNLTISPVR